jgi:hypothetical protein
MLVGAILGLVGSVITNGLEVFKRHQDNKHELLLLEENRKSFQMQQEYGLKRLDLEADIQQFQVVHDHDASLMKRSSKWIVNLSASIRPVTTYWFFAIFAAVKTVPIVYAVLDAVLIFSLYSTSVSTSAAAMKSLTVFMGHVPTIWDPVTAELFAAIMSFWFGDRSMKKWMGRS